jgi:hypothetical protein
LAGSAEAEWWRERAMRAEAEIGALRHEAFEHDLEAAHAIERMEQTEARIDEITGSRSWRLTAPLRRLGSLFRR